MSEPLPILMERSIQIAWDYLERSGELGEPEAASRVLLDSVELMVRQGERRQLVLSNRAIDAYKRFRKELQSVIDRKPRGFGEQPEKYHSDVIFLMGIDADQALAVFHPREGVDRVWPGEGVIYSERLSALRTKSRLSKIVGTPEYRSMTIRNWNTTTKLWEILNA